MHLLQSFPRHLRIDLCGGKIGVAQQHLHHTQVSTVINQVGSKGMSQRMW